MPRETKGLKGIEVKEHNGSNLHPNEKQPCRVNCVLLKNNPLLKTIDNTGIGV